MFPGLFITRRISSQANQFSILKIFHLKPYNERLKVMGWLKIHRRFKERSFLHIDDGSTLKRLQVVVPKSLCPKILAYHTCLCVEGTLVESPGPKQNIELVADNIRVLSPGAPPDYAFTEKGTYLEEDIRLLPHFRARTRNFSSLLRVRSQAKMAIRKYFEEENFTSIDTPILTTNNCEGGGDVFTVKGGGEIKRHEKEVTLGNAPFGHPVFLNVSGQIHLEAMASGLSKVYNFNPAFRGEKGSTRHLHEFWMVEMEEAFLEKRPGYDALMDRIENLIKFTLKSLIETSLEDMTFIARKNGREDSLEESLSRHIERPFVKLKFKDALQILVENKSELETSISASSLDLNKESERFLVRHFGDVPVFVTDWPAASKPFYMYSESYEGQQVALGVDLLMPFGGEVVGGGLREPCLEVLQGRVEEMHLKDHLDWYLDLRRFGYAPSGGFGMGFERFLQFLLGLKNIRDAIPFPRANGQCLC